MKRTYLFDLKKIVEGAANGDYEKVVAYVEKLSERLEADGELEAAERLRQSLDGSKAHKMVGFAKATPGPALAHLPVDSESRLPTADEERLRPGEVDVFLQPAVEKVVGQFVAYFRA